MKGLKGLFIFAAGAVAGAIAGAYLVKDKILADAREEINEVREYYKTKKETKKEDQPMEEQEKEEYKVEESEKEECREIISKHNYANYSKRTEEPETKVEANDTPYVIDPEEFGEEEGYDTMTLTYFADGVLVDDTDDVIDEPDSVVGLENLKVFEEFGASSVYVRNDIWRMDFEIIKDDWNYSDLQDTPKQTEKKPHQL